MTNLFTRIKNSIVADVHEVLDQKETKNPIALLNEYLRQCENETEKVRKLIERQHQLKEKFAREFYQANEMEEKRKRQAEIAARAGETELHEFAQKEQIQYEERAVRLQESLKISARQLGELESKYEEMKHKLKDMHIRRMELMGRENISRAQQRINQVLDQASDLDQPYSRFGEIESYMERLEQQVNSSFYRNTIDAKMAQLEKEMTKEETHSNS